MEVRLEQITDEPFQWQEALTLAPGILERPEVVGLGEIAWSGRVSRTATGFLLEARLSYQQTVLCHRCLSPTVSAEESDLELIILQGAGRPTAGEYELEADDLSVLYIDGDELDLQPLLLEQIHLNVPMRCLCRDDCAGLCPQCGVNRNQESCSCAEGGGDPRWAALEGLRES